MDLAQAKHAFITGGAHGIGLGLADALAARGVRVTITDIDGEALQNALRTRPTMRGHAFDTRDRAAWAEAKAQAEAALGPVDILINNAGIGPNGREFAEMSPGSFDRIIAINLVGVFNGVSAFAADMRARKTGHIVNVSSMAGIASAYPGLGAYAVSKFGVVALTETLHIELAPHGVGVSVLCPGMIQTNLGFTTAKLNDMKNAPGPMPESAMSPAEVAEHTLRGIEDNALFILTHKDRWASVEQRMLVLKQAFGA